MKTYILLAQVLMLALGTPGLLAASEPERGQSPAVVHSQAKDDTEPEGEAQPVLKLSIQSGEANLKMGDEVPIIFTITNEGSMPYHYRDRGYDRSGRMDEYGLYATDEHGQAVEDPRAAWLGGIGGGIASQAILGQGESFKKPSLSIDGQSSTSRAPIE